jgi:nitrogen regulatory protein PII
MKLVTIITRQSRLDEILNALREEGIHGVTVSDVMGSGKQRGRTAYYGGEEYALELTPKVKIELVLPTDRCDGICTRLADAARTGEIGDGKIWVVDVASVVRIRTGETGPEAI